MISVSSRKAKGRALQQTVCKALAAVGSLFGLVPEDFQSRSMGANGTDVILSPAAVKVFGDLKVECKNCQALNVASTYFEHAAKYNNKNAILVHKRNHTPPLVTMFLTDYLELLGKSVVYRA